MARVERIETTETAPVVAMESRSNIVAARIVRLVVGIIEGLLALRLIFRLLGANPNTGFVQFVYGLSDPLVAPFTGIFRSPSVQGNVASATLDTATIVAMLVYALLGWIILRALTLNYRNR